VFNKRVGSVSDYNKFQAIGSATKKARRPNIKCWWRGTNSWWQLADCRCCRQAMPDSGMQHSIRHCGALDCRHRWAVAQSLNSTRWRTSSTVFDTQRVICHKVFFLLHVFMAPQLGGGDLTDNRKLESMEYRAALFA